VVKVASWRWCSVGDDVVVTVGDGGGDGAVDGGCGAAGDAAQQQGGGVEASELVDRVDRVRRNIIGFGRKTHRKTFPVAGGNWPDNMGERERVKYMSGLKVKFLRNLYKILVRGSFRQVND
ncbi:hypothetical protein Tco_0986666, partial [Tanacetum coccineum]